MFKHSSLLSLFLFISTLPAQPTTMHKINIAPLLVNHAEEITADIVSLYNDKVIDSVAFSFTLVPEGVPPVDKAAEYTRRFKIFQKLLKEKGVPTGILIQATWGHGWIPDSPTDFQQIRRIDGGHQYTMCPEGEPFRDYVRKAIMTAAAAQPAARPVECDARHHHKVDGLQVVPVGAAWFKDMQRIVVAELFLPFETAQNEILSLHHRKQHRFFFHCRKAECTGLHFIGQSPVEAHRPGSLPAGMILQQGNARFRLKGQAGGRLCLFQEADPAAKGVL